MRGEPTIIVTCDECGDDVEMGMTALARGSYDERNLNASILNMGWEIRGDKDICSDCVNEERRAEKEDDDDWEEGE